MSRAHKGQAVTEREDELLAQLNAAQGKLRRLKAYRRPKSPNTETILVEGRPHIARIAKDEMHVSNGRGVYLKVSLGSLEDVPQFLADAQHVVTEMTARAKVSRADRLRREIEARQLQLEALSETKS